MSETLALRFDRLIVATEDAFEDATGTDVTPIKLVHVA